MVPYMYSEQMFPSLGCFSVNVLCSALDYVDHCGGCTLLQDIIRGSIAWCITWRAVFNVERVEDLVAKMRSHEGTTRVLGPPISQASYYGTMQLGVRFLV
jgi:hypothetical protein